MPAAVALPRPVAPRRGSRQIAGRACVQIDRICTHNECIRHDSAAAPNGGYRTLCDRRVATVCNGTPDIRPVGRSRHGERHRVMVNIVQRLRSGRSNWPGTI
jgi:hypothetical protein